MHLSQWILLRPAICSSCCAPKHHAHHHNCKPQHRSPYCVPTLLSTAFTSHFGTYAIPRPAAASASVASLTETPPPSSMAGDHVGYSHPILPSTKKSPILPLAKIIDLHPIGICHTFIYLSLAGTLPTFLPPFRFPRRIDSPFAPHPVQSLHTKTSGETK